MRDVAESDWKLFKKMLPQWQERYMKKLIGQYVEILNDRHPQQNGANAGPPNGCPAFTQIKPAKINLSLFGRLLGALEGADHVDLVERSVGGEVDDKRKAKGKHHGEYVA